MSSNSHLNHLPLQAMTRSLASVATGLSSIPTDDLNPLTALLHATNVLRASSPFMDFLITRIGPIAMIAIGIRQYVWNPLSTGSVVGKILSHFTATITVGHGHMLNMQVTQWLSENVASTDKKDLTLHGDGTLKTGSSLANHQDQDQDRMAPLSYIPAAKQNVSVWFAGHKISISRGEPKQVEVCDSEGKPIAGRSKTQNADITFSCFSLSRNPEPIQRLLDHIRTISEQQVTQMTAFYCMNSHHYLEQDESPWMAPVFRPCRDMDSLVLEASTKSSLLHDVASYLSPESKTYYHKRGIPHRRGLLFFGPPGTGKTSSAVALAGHFGLSVFIVSLSSDRLDDDRLLQMFNQLPEKCLVLLEDVDSAGITRENMAKKKQTDHYGPEKKSVTLSGLLNAIDGPCSQEGRLLVLTSNTPDSLDPALVRPGRCDRKFLFGYAHLDIIERLFLSAFTENPSVNLTATELIDMSKEFSTHIPKNTLTPAEIQGFLLEHHESPAEALSLVPAWAKALVETKAAGKIVNSFKGQVGVEDAEATDSEVDADGAAELSDAESADGEDDSEDTDSDCDSEDGGVLLEPL